MSKIFQVKKFEVLKNFQVKKFEVSKFFQVKKFEVSKIFQVKKFEVSKILQVKKFEVSKIVTFWLVLTTCYHWEIISSYCVLANIGGSDLFLTLVDISLFSTSLLNEVQREVL